MKTKSLLAAALAAFFPLFVFAETAATPPTDAPSLHKLSVENLQRKKTKEAVDFAEQATKADPTKPEYFSQLGVALSMRLNEVNFMQMAMLSGKMKKAFEKSVELDPNHVPGLIGLTRFHLNAPEIAGGSLAKGREYASRIREIVPYLGETELGRLAEKSGDHAAALAHYETAAKLRPESAGLQTLAGNALVKLGRPEEARARFEAALKLDPEFADAKKSLASLPPPSAN